MKTSDTLKKQAIFPSDPPEYIETCLSCELNSCVSKESPYCPLNRTRRKRDRVAYDPVEVVARYKNGETAMEIAKTIGVTRSAVNYQLQKAGLMAKWSRK